MTWSKVAPTARFRTTVRAFFHPLLNFGRDILSYFLSPIAINIDILMNQCFVVACLGHIFCLKCGGAS